MGDLMTGMLVGVAITLVLVAVGIFRVASLIDEEYARKDDEDDTPALELVPGLEVRVTDAETGEVFYGTVFREAA